MTSQEELRYKQMHNMLGNNDVQDLVQPMVDSKEVLLGSGQAVPQQSDRSNSTSNYFDFFVTFKQLYQESLQYKESLKSDKESNRIMKRFEQQENYPFSKFASSRQLISFKDSLKNITYRDFSESSGNGEVDLNPQQQKSSD